ncbi:MAG: hypothetical protein QFX40_01680 [Archaeoglobales archaeon]|nr:hypothetical protein [Archaeoglobales archaeon]
MAKRLERRSARVLAIVLALIMVGSIFAYISPKGNIEQRDVKLEFLDFKETAAALNASFYEYLNFTYAYGLKTENEVYKLVANASRSFDSKIFNQRVIQLPYGVREALLTYYEGYQTPIYALNTNKSKIYFASTTSEQFYNFSLRMNNREVALVDEVEPLIIGYTPVVVLAMQKILAEPNKELYSYLSRINETFGYAFFLFGSEAENALKSNETSYGDFYFEGYRFNETSSMYEKVVAIHFTENYFFVGMNESEKNVTYYSYENYDDGLSIAIFADKDFKRVLDARPEIRGIIMHFEE